MVIKIINKRFIFRFFSIIALIVLSLSGLNYLLFSHTSAAVSGQTTLYLKKDPSDVNPTYNSLSLSPGDTQADTASSATSTTNYSSLNFCESSNNTGETFTQVSASAASTGERCIGTFISPPVGQSFSMSTTDSASISANIYSSESSSQATSAPKIYLFRWNGTGTIVNLSDQIMTTPACADPGTTPSVCTAAQTPSSPANNISFAATDRIVLILTQNVTRSRTGATVSNYFDNSTRTPSASIKLGYNIITPNTPSLTGAMDDDFNNAQASTGCAATTYHSKWTCNAPSASGSSADINSADMTPSGGDSSGWLALRDQCASCTVSNFGTTPSNAFIYQSLPASYGSGSIRTVVNSALSYQIGATTPVSPYNHVGLVLWTSNTDYLEIQLYSTGVKSSANTVQVALNNSSSLSGATNINTVTTAGTFGLVWLGFVNTSGSWQAQYSTDGSTWNNIGSAVNHSLFTRAGLNSFAAVSGANYAGAFDWFQSTLSPVAYTQTSYAWFTDADAAAPGVVLTSNNTPVTLTATGQHVRLRALVKISGQSPIDGSAFNLQYVDPGGGSCASPTGGTPASYTNVSTSTLIAFGTYASNTDQMNISSATGDPTDSPNTVVPEVFNKTNSLITNHQAALNNSSDGMWDFGLFDNGAVQGKTYCLRLIMNDGVTALGSYTNYPQITIYQAGPTTDQVMSGGQYFSGGVKQPFFWAK